jgi:hypothetical protein
MTKITQASAALFAAFLTTQALAIDPAPVEPIATVPENVKIRSIQYNGNGCPSMTPDILGSNESGGHQLALSIPPMIAEWGPGISKVESRKSCVISLDLDVPEGWQYALSTFETRGFADLDAGIKGEITLTNFFEGSASSQRHVMHFQGPYTSDFGIKESLPFTTQQWSRCDVSRKLNILLASRLNQTQPNPNSQGLLVVGSEWESAAFKFAFAWRRCPS